jgi:hypothetical protein
MAAETNEGITVDPGTLTEPGSPGALPMPGGQSRPAKGSEARSHEAQGLPVLKAQVEATLREIRNLLAPSGVLESPDPAESALQPSETLERDRRFRPKRI